jgi:hypothetical protein
MTLDWAKSIQARMEGRTAIICVGLGFCGFCLWLFVTHPLANFFISTVLIFLTLALASGILLRTILSKPQPSEPAAQFLLQQIGNRVPQYIATYDQQLRADVSLIPRDYTGATRVYGRFSLSR